MEVLKTYPVRKSGADILALHPGNTVAALQATPGCGGTGLSFSVPGPASFKPTRKLGTWDKTLICNPIAAWGSASYPPLVAHLLHVP